MQRSITTPIPRRTLIAAAVLIVLFAATLVLPGSHQSWAADEISETMYDVFDQLRGLQTPEALFGDHQHFPDHRYRPIDPLVALGGIGPKPEGREG